MTPEKRTRRVPIPLTILTGPIGAGKTTLLNRLLRHPDLAGTGVIVNEAGAVPVAGALIERADDGIIALGGGCVCCTVRGELIDALERLLRGLDNGRVATLARVVIETAGMADPGAILAAVTRHPYLPLRFRPDTIVTAVKAADIDRLLDESETFVRQAALADVIAVAGSYSADTATLLKGINPGAVIVDAVSISPSEIVRRRPVPARDPRPKTAGAALRGREARRIHAFTVVSDSAMTIAALDRLLDDLATLQGPRLIRINGLVAVEREPDKALQVDGVGGVFMPPVLLESWPDADRRTRIAAITLDLDQDTFERYFRAFMNEARIDGPDRDALINNPLAVAGFSARSVR